MKNFGLSRTQRRSFYEGSQIIFEDFTTSYPTATIFHLDSDVLRAGIYDIVTDGVGALSSFSSRSQALAKSLGVNKIEIFYADIQNLRLSAILKKRGFESGNPILINEFGFNKEVTTLRRTIDLTLEHKSEIDVLSNLRW